MNMLQSLTFKMIRTVLITKIKDAQFKKDLIKAINNRVDIPNLSEQREEELMTAIVDSLLDYLKLR